MFCSQCGFKNSEDFNFCTSCGVKRQVDAVVSSQSSNVLSTFKEIASSVQIEILGKDGEALSKNIAISFKEKNSSKLLFNLYASENFFVVLPVSKDKSGLVWWGLLLGGGVFAGAAVGALEVLSKKLESKNAIKATETDDALKNALIFPNDALKLSVKEKRADTGSLSDLYKKDTWFLLSGYGMYDGRKYDASVMFAFAGQVTNPNKPRLTTLDLICSTLKIPIPTVHVGKNPPF